MSKPSDMRPEEVQAIITEVYGPRGQTRAAAEIQRGEVTISRWCSGTTPVATTEALLLRMILVLHRKGVNWRKWVDEYQNGIHISLDDVI